MRILYSAKYSIIFIYVELKIDIDVFLKIDEDYTVLQKRMEEAQKEYKDALNNMPGAWSLVGLSMTESICSTLLPAISMATVAGVAGATMSNLEFLASAGALANGAKKMMDSNGNNANCNDGEDDHDSGEK
jgi:hypothetical protein